ncbi:MAG TPA: hypothetical protein VFN27_10175 [Xanthobacteraceae bacterium]|nr:hypothetical protein [Xanthobacteraceae bacterium]
MNDTLRELTDAELEIVGGAGWGTVLLTAAECAVAGAAVGGLAGGLLGAAGGLGYAAWKEWA